MEVLFHHCLFFLIKELNPPKVNFRQIRLDTLSLVKSINFMFSIKISYVLRGGRKLKNYEEPFRFRRNI